MKLELPVLSLDTDLNKAIEQLRKRQVAALVVEYKADENRRYHLLSAGNIVIGLKRGRLEKLSELEPDETFVVPERVGILSRIPFPNIGQRRKEASAGNYVVSATDMTATLYVADSEMWRGYTSGPADYYCDGPPRHSFTPPPDLTEGDICPIDGIYKIVSSR